MSQALDRAAKTLIASMGSNPRKLIPGTVDIAGHTVHWEENCRATHKRSGGPACAHFRTSAASPDALDAFFAVADREVTK